MTWNGTRRDDGNNRGRPGGYGKKWGGKQSAVGALRTYTHNANAPSYTHFIIDFFAIVGRPRRRRRR